MAIKKRSSRKTSTKGKDEDAKSSKHFSAQKANAKQKNANTNGSDGRRKTVEKEDSSVTTQEDSDSDSAYGEPSEEEEAEDFDSDHLDDSDSEKVGKKRKVGKTSPKKSSPKRSSRKKQKKEEDEDFESDLEEGQELVGRIIEAPKTGRVPPGQISQNTLSFLKKLAIPEYNDRDWFKQHEPVYRLAEKEWKDFVEEFTLCLTEADPQIPVLPPNDVIHRIYRDVRFSNDKTPYKKGFSASFSRTGRKGIFAVYHLLIKPGGSLLAAGSWCPGKNELQTIRNKIMRSPRRIRDLISQSDFVQLYGEPKPHPKGKRQSIFGGEDELKHAPKGVAKDHKDIDLLRCRSFAVVHNLTDAEVLDPDFKHHLQRMVEVTRPFVHGLNDLMTLSDDQSDDGSQAEDEGGAVDD